MTSDQLAALRAAARAAADSPLRFADGGQYRVEIPSVEGPAAFEAVIATAENLGVPLHRVSQGSGITLLRDSEIVDLAQLGAAHGIEVCLFVGPRAPWDGASAGPLAPDGRYLGWRHTTVASLQHAYADVVRATQLGIRSVLVADEGLIQLIAAARTCGELPADLIVKASAVMGIANPLGAALLAKAGSDTLNIGSDVAVGELAAFRATVTCPLDLYVEGPDGLGGFLRYGDLPELVRVGAPMHLKFGLRNAPSIYPSGGHLERVAIDTGRERVRRAAIGLEALARHATGFVCSPTGQTRSGVPQHHVS
jgi:hypothetical protein